jgi:hypothetical protein
MTPPLPPASIRRCSAQSRSSLPEPDGPAGAPPGQRLRSGALIGLRENREQKQDPYYKVSTVRGEPRARPPQCQFGRDPEGQASDQTADHNGGDGRIAAGGVPADRDGIAIEITAWDLRTCKSWYPCGGRRAGVKIGAGCSPTPAVPWYLSPYVSLALGS